jgi:hypothetical protein
MTIVSFGKRERRKFLAEGPLGKWRPVSEPGIFAVTYKQDPVGRPKSHTVLYFGECDNLATQAPMIDSQFKQWIDQNADFAELFVFSHQMPGSSKYERSKVAHDLVAEYDPEANN